MSFKRPLTLALWMLLAAAPAGGVGMRQLDGTHDGWDAFASDAPPAGRPPTTTQAASLILTGTQTLEGAPLELPLGEKSAIEDVIWIEADGEQFGRCDGWLGGVWLLAFTDGGPGLRIRCAPRRADASLEYIDASGAWVDTGYDVPSGTRIRIRTILRPALGRMDVFVREGAGGDEVPLLTGAACPPLVVRRPRRVFRCEGIRFRVRVHSWQLWDTSDTGEMAWTGSPLLPRLRIAMDDGRAYGAARLRRSGGAVYAVLPTYPGFNDSEGFASAHWPHLRRSVTGPKPMVLSSLISQNSRPYRPFNVPLGEFEVRLRFRIPAETPANRQIEVLRFGISDRDVPVGPFLAAIPNASKAGHFRLFHHGGIGAAAAWAYDLPLGKWVTLTARVRPMEMKFTYKIAPEGKPAVPGHGGKALAFYGGTPATRTRLASQPWCRLRSGANAKPVVAKGGALTEPPETFAPFLKKVHLKVHEIRGAWCVRGGRIYNATVRGIVDTDLTLGDAKLRKYPRGISLVTSITYDPTRKCWWLVGYHNRKLWRLDEQWRLVKTFDLTKFNFYKGYPATMRVQGNRFYFLHSRKSVLVTDAEFDEVDQYMLKHNRGGYLGLCTYGDFILIFRGHQLRVYSRRAREFCATIKLPRAVEAGRTTWHNRLTRDGDTLYVGFGQYGKYHALDLKQFGRFGLDAEYLHLREAAVKLTQPRVDRTLADAASALRGWSGLAAAAPAKDDLPAGRDLTLARFAETPALGYVGPHAGQIRSLRISAARGTPMACLTVAVGRKDKTLDARTFIALVDPAHLKPDAPRRIRVRADDFFRRKKHLVAPASLRMSRYEPEGVPRDSVGLLVAADPTAEVTVDLLEDLGLKAGVLPDQLELKTVHGEVRVLAVRLASDDVLAAPAFRGGVTGPVLDLGASVGAVTDAQWIAPTLAATRAEAAVQIRFAGNRFDLPRVPWQAAARFAPDAKELPAARFFQWRVLLEGKDPYVTPVMGDLQLQFRRILAGPGEQTAAGFRLDPKLFIFIPAVGALAAVFALCFRGYLRRRRADRSAAAR